MNDNMFLNVFFILLVHINSLYIPLSFLQLESQCVQQTVRNAEVITSESFDMDQDGNLDQVLIYGDDNLDVLIVSDAFAPTCRVVLDKNLIFRQLTTGRQDITIKSVELVEVTGDTQPELHIWLEKSKGGPREEVVLHTIYLLRDGNWQEGFGSLQCLAFSSFQFRVSPNGMSKDIYEEEDVHCEPPWSSGRTYTLFRWDGSQFTQIENGIVPNSASQTYPGWMNLVCLIPFVIPMLAFFGLLWLLRIRRSG